MKKVQKASIAGLSFTLEEAAYHNLSLYLNKLETYYQEQEGGKDIIEGIEERLAELLSERLTQGVNVVSEEMVARAIEVLGTPEDIESEEPTAKQNRSAYFKPQKRFHRDLDNRIISGVLGGFAAFCNIDPVLVRLGYAILTLVSLFSELADGGVFVSLIVLYVLLTLIVPGARSVAQKCAMRGKPLSAKNIEENIANAGYYDPSPRTQNHFWSVVGRAVAIIFGLILICFSLPVILAVVVGLAFGSVLFGILPVLPFTTLLGLTGVWAVVLKICALLVTFVPLLYLIYLGCKLIFNFNTGPNRKRLGLYMFLIWFLALVMLCVSGVQLFKQAAPNGKVYVKECEYTIRPAADTLVLEMNYPRDLPSENFLYEIHENKYNIAWVNTLKRSEQLCIMPRIQITETRDTAQTFSVKVEKRRIWNRKDVASISPLQQISCQNDSLIQLNPHVIANKSNWDGGLIELEVKIPKGKTLLIKGPVEQILDHNTQPFYRHQGLSNYLNGQLLSREDRLDLKNLIFR